MSDNEDEDFNASYEADNPDETKEISCLNESVISEVSNDGLDSSLSFSSIASDAPASSTPKKRKRNSKKSSVGAEPPQTGPFKVPAPPPVLARKCPKCGKGLKTLTGLNNHTLAHTWKDLTAQKPSGSAISNYCHEAQRLVLDRMVSSPKGGKLGPNLNQYVAKIVDKKDTPEWKKMIDAVSSLMSRILEFNNKKNSATFGSALRNHLYQSLGKELNNPEKRDDLMDLLMNVEVVYVKVANIFLFEFLQRMGNCCLAFIFRSISGRTGDERTERRNRSKDNFLSLKSQQLVHYIAGSCMKSHLRHCYKYPKNATLRNRKNVILTKFATSPPTVAEKKDVSYWTAVMNRKSLFFVNEEAFQFFLELARLLQTTELATGGLNHEAVIPKVIETPSLLSKWDNIIGSSMDDEESFSFMVKVIRTLTNTYGVGVLLRRQNQMWKKGKGNKGSISTSHRAKLLRK